MDVVEIDGEVVDVARRFFAFPDDPRVHVHVEDGRRFLQATRERYDLIMLDAFYSDSVPAHLTTREFVALARDHLAPAGALVSNVGERVDPQKTEQPGWREPTGPPGGSRADQASSSPSPFFFFADARVARRVLAASSDSRRR